MPAKAKIGVLGASGYTGAELVRLLSAIRASRSCCSRPIAAPAKPMADVFAQFAPYALPTLTSIEDADWKALKLDLVFCALPHGTTQKVIKDLMAQRDAHQGGRPVGRFPPGRSRRLCALVRPRAFCAGTAEEARCTG